jgi:hypothetical protein
VLNELHAHQLIFKNLNAYTTIIKYKSAYNTSISYRLSKQNIFLKWRCNRLYNIFALASMQDDTSKSKIKCGE